MPEPASGAPAGASGAAAAAAATDGSAAAVDGLGGPAASADPTGPAEPMGPAEAAGPTRPGGHRVFYGLGVAVQTLLWFLLFLAIVVAVAVGGELTEFRYVGF
jgi:hypothetical protein